MDVYDGETLTNVTHINLTTWYYEFLRKKCRIGAKLIKWNKDNKGDFNGSELIKIFRDMNFKKYFPGMINLKKKRCLGKNSIG